MTPKTGNRRDKEMDHQAEDKLGTGFSTQEAHNLFQAPQGEL